MRHDRDKAVHASSEPYRLVQGERIAFVWVTPEESEPSAAHFCHGHIIDMTRDFQAALDALTTNPDVVGLVRGSEQEWQLLSPDADPMEADGAWVPQDHALGQVPPAGDRSARSRAFRALASSDIATHSAFARSLTYGYEARVYELVNSPSGVPLTSWRDYIERDAEDVDRGHGYRDAAAAEHAAFETSRAWLSAPLGRTTAGR